MNNKRGMALIVALLTSFILLALVASLFWVIASTSRQTEYARNSAIALNLAEAGAADAIYRLNYETVLNTGAYPFVGTANPFGTSASDFVTLPQDILTTALFPLLITGANSGIKGTFTENGGVYYVGIQDNAYPDTLVAIGIYKGVRRILTTSLRGNNVGATLRQDATSTQGISEAFNKHVIYANTVTYTAGTVSGNIIYTNTCNSGTGTKTYIEPGIFGVPIPGAPPDLPTYISDQDVYQESTAGVAELTVGGIVQPWPVGVTYDNSTDTFTFDAGYGRTNRIYVKASAEAPPPHSGIAIIDGATIQNFLKADGTITVQGAPTFSGTNTVLNPLSGTITVTPGITITGNLIVEGATLLTLNGVTVTKNVVSNGDITLSGAFSINSDATSTDSGAVSVVKTTGAGTATITISAGASPTIRLGSNQNTAIICYSTVGAVTVNVNANLTPTYDNIAQAAIVAYSTGGTANVNIGDGSNAPTVDDSSTSGKSRLIYSSSFSGTGVITLDNTTGTVFGALVTNTVNLTSGNLTYNSSFFVAPNNFASDIYKGFSGGRRAYVPTWQGWRLR